MPAATKADTLVRLARNGPVRARDLNRIGVPRTYLKRLVDQGVLEHVDRGLYRLAAAPVSELQVIAHVAARVPHAIICLLSALQIHRLTIEAPHAVWVLIERNARALKLAHPKLEIVRASGAAHEHGVETRTIDGVAVRITNPAKTVADCFRYRRHVGIEVAIAALRDYLRRRPRGRNIDALVEAAKADRIYATLRPYLEALA